MDVVVDYTDCCIDAGVFSNLLLLDVPIVAMSWKLLDMLLDECAAPNL